ncbi:MAG: ribose-phosphate pyrophosphokinase [Planctomycetes bacterium]|nr:ribose-phosphate pyrophosphokinase [Planctomycetota bacterium]
MTNNNFQLKVFSGRAHVALAEKIAQAIGDPLGKIELKNFPDGETWARIDEDVRGRDVFIVQPTCHPVNEHLMELLIMLDSFKRASAARITVVLPYYGYARQDRKAEGRVPITAKLVANLLTTAGTQRVITVDLHAAQIQGFFDIPVDHLYASPVIVNYVRRLGFDPREMVVLSPDEGSVKRVLRYQKKLAVNMAIVDKRRISAEQVENANLIGASLEGKIALIFDDMISTANTVVSAARTARTVGKAKAVYILATHGVLCGPAIKNLREAPVEKIAVTDTIPLPPEKRLPNMEVLTVADLLADAIKRIHVNQSVSELFV